MLVSDDIVTRLRTAASNNRVQAERGTDTSHSALSSAQKAGKCATADTHEEAANEIELLRGLLAAYVADENRFNKGNGEPYGSITVETGMLARAAIK